MSLYSFLYLPRSVDLSRFKPQNIYFKESVYVDKTRTEIFPLTDDFREYMYIRSAFRVSDEEIRLSVIKDVNNTNSLAYVYGDKQGRVVLECHLPTCPDFFSPPCTVNGYIGRILKLTSDDNDEVLVLKSKTGIVARINVEDVRKPAKHKNPTYPHTLGVCLQPMYYVTDYPMLIQFFEFWLNEGSTKFYFYWESMSPQVKDLIEFYQATSNAEIELIPWSRLPVSPTVTIKQNPNAYWFRLEVFLGIFDCMMRARYNVKYIAQTDLDETIFVNGSQTLIEYMESMNKKHPDLVDVQFLSRRAYINGSNEKISHPFKFSFEPYEAFIADVAVFKKPLYTKMIHRPERDFKVHIHRSQLPELIPGTNKRYKHVDAPPMEASVFHFRKQSGMYSTGKTFNTTSFAAKAEQWLANFENRQLTSQLSETLDWVYSVPKFAHALEICRQKQNKARAQRCHNLLECEVHLDIEKETSLIRANNSWIYV
uniref:Glycosyltransferase family 92 protein n=1 Tax=Panagrellus redivivus TaxID=6233 RepID=A0A7E4ZS61_PANRE